MYKAVVTGASSGIGKAIYDGLKRNPEFEVCGVSRRGPDRVLDLSKDIPGTFSDIDLLINCAGILTFDETEETMNVNFWGTYKMIKHTIFNKGACIINIASVSGIIADPETPIYGASKAAIISLTKSLAKKFAPKIRVNCISPGFYKTNLVPEEIPQQLIDGIPLGYADVPDHLFEVVMMIWNTKYLTGANIVVDGGVSL